MAVNISRKTILAAKTETNSGEAVSLNYTGGMPGNNTQLVYGDGAAVWQADTTMVDMPALTGSLSPKKQLAGRSLANVSLQTCLMQDPSIATVDNIIPSIDPLLVACGMKHSPNSTATYKQAYYSPTSNIADLSTESGTVCSATVRAYQGGGPGQAAIKTESNGVYLNAEFNFTAGQAATIQFTGQGIYVDPVSSTATSPTFPVDTKTLVESMSLSIAPEDTQTLANKESYRVHPICRSMTLNSGNTIIERGDINSGEGLKGLRIASRAPTMNLVVEADPYLESTYSNANTTAPWFASLKENNRQIIRMSHRTNGFPGSCYVFMEAFAAQLTSVNLSDDGGIRVYNLAYSLQQTSEVVTSAYLQDPYEWQMLFHNDRAV